MGRRPRIHFVGAFYQVISRGNQGQKVFREDADYRLYLQFLREYKKRFGFFLYGYALMPTHVHLLIETGETALSKVMQSLQFRYTRNMNIKYQTWGHLFQGRYKAILCQKDSYFLELSAYLHLNPVRSGLVDDPLKYAWSSYACYMGKETVDWVDRNFLLVQFSGNKSVAKRKYGEFVKSRMGQGHREEFYKLKDQRFLGGDEFVDEIHHRVKEEPTLIYDIPVSEIVSVVELILGISRGGMYGFTRGREGAWGRSAVAFLGRKWGGYPLKRLAEHFGRDPVAISKGVKRVEKRMMEDEFFVLSLKKMEELLIRNKKPKIVH